MEIINHIEIDQVLQALNAINKGSYHIACCPAHDDSSPSLQLTQEGDRLLVRCFAGCSFLEIKRAIADKLGVKINEVPIGIEKNDDWKPVDIKRPKQKAKEYSTSEAALRVCFRGEATTNYEYIKDGETVAISARYESKDGKKTFRQLSKLKSGKWIIKGPENPPLFNEHKITDSDDFIFIVEGEKAAIAGDNLGLRTLTSIGGSNAPQKSNFNIFNESQRVIIIPDNDRPGEKYARYVHNQIKTPVNILRLCNDMNEGDDLFDYIKQESACGLSYEEIKKQIFERVYLQIEIDDLESEKRLQEQESIELYRKQKQKLLDDLFNSSRKDLDDQLIKNAPPAVKAVFAELMEGEPDSMKELAFSNALSFVSNIIGQNYTYETGPHTVRANLIFFNVAPSGSGKSAMNEKLANIFEGIIKPETLFIKGAELGTYRGKNIRKNFSKPLAGLSSLENERTISSSEALYNVATPGLSTPIRYDEGQAFLSKIKSNQYSITLPNSLCKLVQKSSGSYTEQISTTTNRKPKNGCNLNYIINLEFNKKRLLKN